MNAVNSVPDIDAVGQLVPSPNIEQLRREVAQLLNHPSNRFPGAQPVSFTRAHFEELKRRDYYVCEKSDGIRCLLYFTKLIAPDGSVHESHYLIDRKNNYYHVPGLHFPRPNVVKDAPIDFQSFHIDTLLDGELLWDTYPSGERLLKYLVFDSLVIDGQNLCQRGLDRRLAGFIEQILNPYHKLWENYRPDCEQFRFRLEKKDTQRSYGLSHMFKFILPKLKHTSDGLIFTCRETSYKFGTDDNILKWKPAEENTVDFKLDLRFPPLRAEDDVEMTNGGHASDAYDYSTIPRCDLHAYNGDREPDHLYGTLDVTPAEWDRMKAWAIARDDGLDGQIIECHRDEEHRWRFNRFREDKTEANHLSIVEKVKQSIEDGVSQQDLEAVEQEIRAAWKARDAALEAARKGT